MYATRPYSNTYESSSDYPDTYYGRSSANSFYTRSSSFDSYPNSRTFSSGRSGTSLSSIDHSPSSLARPGVYRTVGYIESPPVPSSRRYYGDEKPPLPRSTYGTSSRSSYASQYGGTNGYSSGYSYAGGSLRHPPRSVSSDRGYVDDDTRRVLPGQVHSLATKFERYVNTDTRRTQPSTPRVNGYTSESVYGRSRARVESFSSDDSIEGKDTLSSLPGPSPLYRGSPLSASISDVPSSRKRLPEVPNGNSDDTRFKRGEDFRSSSGSEDSSGSLNRLHLGSDGEGRPPLETLQRSKAQLPSTPSTATKSGNLGKAGLLGMANIGNTCFMSSGLQCLSHTRPLKEYCLKDGTSDCNNSSRMKGALMRAFSELLSQLWSPTRTNYVSPDNFKAQIQKFAPRFVGYSQQDSQEFLRYFLMGLHEDVNRARKSSPLPPIDDSLPDEQKSMEAWKRYIRIDDSKIVDIFVGQLKSELKCTHCGHVSSTFDPFWDLSLQIVPERRRGDVSLYDCLDAFTREEILDGDEKPKCEKCKVHRKCTKRFSIQKLPRFLVLHLKRFSGERYRSRLSTLVNFPARESLDLRDYVSSPTQKGCTEYGLYAVSNHSGTPMMGHYTAYTKHHITGEWHLYDDTRVSKVDVQSVVSSEAYVLFYELKQSNL